MTAEIMQQAEQVIAKTYQRFTVVLETGSGCTLVDTSGRRFIDFVAGIAVCNLGHAHEGITRAVIRQAQALWHVSNLYYTVPQVELAAWLVAHSFADRVFFCNSGAEANEALLKLDKFAKKKLKVKPKVVVPRMREFYAWIGASKFALALEAGKLWITERDYMEAVPSVVNE